MDNKISLDLDETIKGKIDAALQKPAGLTKTELVGVGTNGQENIEIGDNLTLANGKLSATGGGSGGDAFDIIRVSADGTTYTGNISGTKPVIIYEQDSLMETSLHFIYTQGFLHNGEVSGVVTYKIDPFTNKYVVQSYTGGKTETLYKIKLFNLFSHFISIEYGREEVYFQYYSLTDKEMNLNSLKEVLSGKKIICTGVIKTVDGRFFPALYVTGQLGRLDVYHDSGSGLAHTEITDLYNISDLVTPVE